MFSNERRNTGRTTLCHDVLSQKTITNPARLAISRWMVSTSPNFRLSAPLGQTEMQSPQSVQAFLSMVIHPLSGYNAPVGQAATHFVQPGRILPAYWQKRSEYFMFPSSQFFSLIYYLLLIIYQWMHCVELSFSQESHEQSVHHRWGEPLWNT